MSNHVKVAVLVTPGYHPVSGRPRPAQADVAALGVAQTISTSLKVLTAGAPSDASLDGYLGLGASEIEVLGDEGCDIVDTLQPALSGQELILLGGRADGGEASGLLPYQLSAQLGVPLVPDALTVKLVGRLVRVTQFMPKGLRREVEVSLPAIIAVHPRAPINVQYAFAKARQGRLLRSRIGSTGKVSSYWQYEAATRRPLMLKAKLKQSGHARMLGAIASDDGKSGGQVVKTGDAVAKAQVVLDYLREHRLIDF
ncbi:electron transfer flavoprotein subunit beta [Leeia sp. TBRC 13508]|uniref:Electron transfer flavoprotein subunit beta n=1 Tax=Leeia speluncae TaxID=2884804 RepID=A0ABS8DAD3_9NEIS|nr:electron transfer flavoprotein subunit beta [Leeia speluncae]MCB6185174.1 electron transfer flavoprotein subunit beta [Leeia speluncae]